MHTLMYNNFIFKFNNSNNIKFSCFINQLKIQHTMQLKRSILHPNQTPPYSNPPHQQSAQTHPQHFGYDADNPDEVAPCKVAVFGQQYSTVADISHNNREISNGKVGGLPTTTPRSRHYHQCRSRGPFGVSNSGGRFGSRL